MDRRQELARVCGEYGVAAVYLFGSRAADGVAALAGVTAEGSGSDLDVGLLFFPMPAPAHLLSRLQVAMEDVFAPLRVDLVPLDRVDPIFQYRVIDGDRVLALAPRAADLFELEVMRGAAELLPVPLHRSCSGRSSTVYAVTLGGWGLPRGRFKRASNQPVEVSLASRCRPPRVPGAALTTRARHR